MIPSVSQYCNPSMRVEQRADNSTGAESAFVQFPLGSFRLLGDEPRKLWNQDKPPPK